MRCLNRVISVAFFWTATLPILQLIVYMALLHHLYSAIPPDYSSLQDSNGAVRLYLFEPLFFSPFYAPMHSGAIIDRFLSCVAAHGSFRQLASP